MSTMQNLKFSANLEEKLFTICDRIDVEFPSETYTLLCLNNSGKCM